MTEQDLIHKIEWVNKRCSLKGEPLTQSQIELLMFVFADTVVNKNLALADVSNSVYCDCDNPTEYTDANGETYCSWCGKDFKQ